MKSVCLLLSLVVSLIGGIVHAQENRMTPLITEKSQLYHISEGEECSEALLGVKINEVQVANIDQYIDHSFNYGGWIELYNSSGSSYELNKAKIRHTDADGVVEEYELNSSHGLISQGAYVCLWFDHNSSDGVYGGKAYLQIPFKMDPEGGVVELLGMDGTIVDVVDYPPSISRCAYARVTDGGDEWGWTAYATPKGSNEGSAFADERLEVPIVSEESTLFTADMNVKVEIPKGATLKYTTDGSAPTVFHGSVSENGVFEFDTTTVFRFVLIADGKLPSQVITRTFIKDENNLQLPILCVSTAPENLYDDMIGLYTKGVNGVSGNGQVNACNWNMDWERPVNVEYLVKEDEGYYPVLNQEADFNIAGGWTRAYGGGNGWEMKSSFRLKSGKVYEGMNSFDYPVFCASKPYNKYKTLLVRNGGNDTYSRIYDPAIHEIIRRSGFYVDCQAWQPCHVFFNGRYLGMLNLRENNNKHYGESGYGIDTDEMDQFELNGVLGYEQKAGSKDAFWQWLMLSKQLAVNPTDHGVWKDICNMVDIDEYCNYMAVEMYMGSDDWLTGSNNIKGFRCRTDGGKFHLVLFDTDRAFSDKDMLASAHSLLDKYDSRYADNGGVNYVAEIFFNMLQYEPFRQQFIHAYSIVDGSIFEPERCLDIINEMVRYTLPALSLEGNDPTGKANSLYKRISNEGNRKARMDNMKKFMGLTEEYKVVLESNIPEARLLIDGQEVPTRKFDGILYGPVSLTTKAPAGYIFKGWNIISETEQGRCEELIEDLGRLTFSSDTMGRSCHIIAMYERLEGNANILKSGASPVRINEVSAGNCIYVNDYYKKSDWIELYNTTDNEVDVCGMYLSDERSNPQKYQISPEGSDAGTIIPPYGRMVVWCDKLTPINQLHVPFKLDNADGAYVAIQAQDGTWSDEMVYVEQDRWQTYGRYPDGGEHLSLFDKATIMLPNMIASYDYVLADTEYWSDSLTAITLGLEKGWNWMSHNLNSDVHLSRFQGYAEYVMSQSGSCGKDEDGEWSGSLNSIKVATGYKIKMSSQADVVLRGNLFDIDTPISVKQGWNWLGYPLYNATTIEVALQQFIPTEGDAIVGINGFATYESGVWEGTLTSFSPGQAYMLQCNKAQTFCWNPLFSERTYKAKRYSAPKVDALVEAPWQVDVHTYPNVACIIASCCIDEAITDNNCMVAAFCGDECRGVAQEINGLLYMSVYGTENERLCFKLIDDKGETYTMEQTLEFLPECVVGSRKSPFQLSLSDAVGQKPPVLNSRLVDTMYITVGGLRISKPGIGVSFECAVYEDGRTIVKKIVR